MQFLREIIRDILETIFRLLDPPTPRPFRVVFALLFFGLIVWIVWIVWSLLEPEKQVALDCSATFAGIWHKNDSSRYRVVPGTPDFDKGEYQYKVHVKDQPKSYDATSAPGSNKVSIKDFQNEGNDANGTFSTDCLVLTLLSEKEPRKQSFMTRSKIISDTPE